MEEKRRAVAVGTLRSDFLAAWGKLKPGDLEKLREAACGSRHPETADVLSDLGVVCYEFGDV